MTLVGNDKDFEAISMEHRELEKKLHEIDKKHYLTPAEEVDRKKIQKLKLLAKDRMEHMLRQSKG